jgi:hypothetical protein
MGSTTPGRYHRAPPGASRLDAGCDLLRPAGHPLWTEVVTVVSMARLEIHRSSITQLRPSPSAITDGSPDPVPVLVKFGFGWGGMTLHVDRDSARAFARYRWVIRIMIPAVLAITLTLGFLYGKNAFPSTKDPTLGILLVAAASALVYAVIVAYLIPATYPRVFRDSVRLRNVDDSAAGQWLSANHPGAIRVQPDTPTRDRLVKHAPSIVLAAMVIVLLILLT